MAIDPMPPWLQPTCDRLRGAWAQGRLSHALLIEGGRGRGGDWLARWAAALTHCRAPVAPCLGCGDCARVFADQQPDVHVVSPEEDSREIRIDQVRALIGEFALTRHASGRKVAILAPADRLNRNAANALLKTLEEPTSDSLLLLVAAQPSRLPATVRSRCLRLRLPRPARDVALDWLERIQPHPDWPLVLELCGGEPLLARDCDVATAAGMARDTRAILQGGAAARFDPIALAESWARDQYELRLAAVENWITDRLREAAGVPAQSLDLRAGAHLPAPDSGMNIRQLFAALDATREARRLADTPVNKTLVLERLLWMLASARNSRRAS
jgi:DNA polymerase-3 subunit delta'